MRLLANVTLPRFIVLAAIINIVGGALQAASVHVGMFIAARAITGFAAGQYNTKGIVAINAFEPR